jgi:hypothetical protein
LVLCIAGVPEWRVDDSRDLDKACGPLLFDFVFGCPPACQAQTTFEPGQWPQHTLGYPPPKMTGARFFLVMSLIMAVTITVWLLLGFEK